MGQKRSRTAEPLDEQKFGEWMNSAVSAMRGVAVSLAIVGHTAHLRHSSMTHRRLVSANVRDAITLLDSLARDQYRHGGVEGILKSVLGQIEKKSGCFLDRTFRPVKEELRAANHQRPRQIMEKIKSARRDATAHLPETGTREQNRQSFKAEELWVAYLWIKGILSVWQNQLPMRFEWFNEHEIIDEVLLHLSKPIILSGNEGVSEEERFPAIGS